MVIKYGGHAMVTPELGQSFARDVVLISSVGLRPVVVHGGGPQISGMLAKIGKKSEFRDGFRVTDFTTLEVARMVLVRKNRAGHRERCQHERRIGRWAYPVRMEASSPQHPKARIWDMWAKWNVSTPTSSRLLLDAQIIPVVSPIGADGLGQAYNMNADKVAAALAGALKASKVIYLTDVPGLLEDANDSSSVLPEVTVAEVPDMIAAGTITGGMIPKTQACAEALSLGVGSAHMLDGRIPNAVLLELFTDAGVGTMITTGGLDDERGTS